MKEQTSFSSIPAKNVEKKERKIGIGGRNKKILGNNTLQLILLPCDVMPTHTPIPSNLVT